MTTKAIRILTLAGFGTVGVLCIAGMAIFALAHGINGTFMASCAGGIGAIIGTIAGYVAGKSSSEETPVKTINHVPLILLALFLLSACDKNLHADPACIIQAGTKCASELAKCFCVDEANKDNPLCTEKKE